MLQRQTYGAGIKSKDGVAELHRYVRDVVDNQVVSNIVMVHNHKNNGDVYCTVYLFPEDSSNPFFETDWKNDLPSVKEQMYMHIPITAYSNKK